MTVSWLPDAELDPHPHLTWFAEYCFDLTLSALYRIDPIYAPGHQLQPGTLVVSNHQRDMDAPIIAPALCRRNGLRFQGPLPFFASREDLFRPDFLAEYLHGWPRPLRQLLGRIPLAGFFQAMRVEPLRRVREFSLAEAFAELPTADDQHDWLNDRGRCELTSGELPDVDERNKPPQRRAWGLRRLHGQARQLLAPGFRHTVDAQLDRFAGLLDAGRIVYLAPEGRNSRSGRFGRLRAGAWQLTQRSATPPAILPVAVSYDALRGGRLRAIVHVGTPLTDYDCGTRGAFDHMLETRIRQLFAFNSSHLLSRFLVAGPATFSQRDCAQWLGQAREQLSAAGLMLDPQLVHADIDTLASERLDWLRRKALVRRTDNGWANHWPSAAQASWRTPETTVRYCDNTLADYLHALAPNVTLQP